MADRRGPSGQVSPQRRHVALPLPVRGGSVESLAPFVNLASENDFVLVVAWLLGRCEQAAPIQCWP